MTKPKLNQMKGKMELPQMKKFLKLHKYDL